MIEFKEVALVGWCSYHNMPKGSIEKKGVKHKLSHGICEKCKEKLMLNKKNTSWIGSSFSNNRVRTNTTSLYKRTKETKNKLSIIKNLNISKKFEKMNMEF